MQGLETIRTAVNSLRLNKVRSALTMLGVIIGVFSVVSLVSLVRGFQNYVTDQFNAIGSNLIIVTPGFSGFSDDPSKAYTNNKLEDKHVDMLKTYLSDKFIGISPSIRVGKDLKYKTNEYYSTLSAGNYETKDIFDLQLKSGRFFTKSEEETGAKVIVLGNDVNRELFGTKNSIGEYIKIDNESFLVIGYTKEKGQNFDDRVFLPYTTVKKTFDVTKLSSIVLKAKNNQDIDMLMRDVKLTLMRDMKKDDFSVLSQKDIISSIQNILNVISMGLGAIAGISLLVGGIGIMNIMLVSVTERTKEIGLRKALGATSKNIAFQFIYEAVFLSVVGGFIGLLLGWLLTFALKSFVRAEVPLWSIFLALGFSVLVGVIFGTYPAIKASNKDPIEALRYE